MSTALNLPLWQCNSPPNSPDDDQDSSEDFDLIMGRLSSGGKPSFFGMSRPDSRSQDDNDGRSNSASDCESYGRGKYDDECRLNNNASDSGDCDVERCNADRARASGRKRRRSRNVSSSDGEKSGRRKRRKCCGKNGEPRMDDSMCGVSSECDAGTVGGDDDDGEEEPERSPRRQSELDPSDEIDKSDVIMSRDITSNPLTGSESCASGETCGEGRSLRKGSCSAGSYSRRKHHKHKHKRRTRSPTPEEPAPVNPKVNPIFLWVRQDDTRIVEVMCEDYDHRNRIRLTRTHLGWRAIPKTERFSSAIVPKAPSSTETVPEENCVKRSKRRKGGKKKKSKKRKVPVRSEPDESTNTVEESSVTLPENDVELPEKAEACEDAPNLSGRDSPEPPPTPPPRESPPPSRPASAEPLHDECETEEPPRRLTKSFSCDFLLMPKRARTLVRTSSLDLDMDEETRLELEKNFKVQMTKTVEDTQVATEDVKESDPVEEPDKTEVEPDVTKENAKSVETTEDKAPEGEMDIAKRDSDFNDADCDELGELLKDIGELEFAEEEEGQQALEEENDEWLTPTDLTVPKTKTEESKPPKSKYPVLPPNISPLVTVTSTTRVPEPLTAPLPEVTITPIPNPKPAHQQKRQNNFLESLLSSPYPVKPEKDEITVTRCEKRPTEKKKPEESKGKKMKMEDITLKSLLSKQHVEKSLKGLELENHVKKIKSKQEAEHADMSKSRLHELLTEGVSNSDPISQLKQVLSNPDLAVPDPLLVPRARLPALVASPASEIPRLLSMHLDKKVEETPCPPLTDSDMLEVSLSNLRSLLSCNSDKIKSTDADDLASYQKSLEAFLEWQRYQTDLIEARMKNGQLTPGLSPTDIDLATATALNQMLWLPYLEFNGNAMSPPMNPMFPHGYPNNMTALPHISTNHFPQSSPFLTPTSPMDIDAQMKTLAMWQEAVMTQQNAHQSRKIPSTLVSSAQMDGRNIKVPNLPSQKKQRPSPIPSPQKTRNYSPRQEPQKNHFNFDSHLQLQQLQQQQEAFLRQQYEMQRKQQRRSTELHRQSEHHRPRQEQMHRLPQNFEADAEKKSRGPGAAKPYTNPGEKSGRGGRKQSWQQLEQDWRKNAQMTNQMALRWHQFEEEMRRNRMRGKPKADNYADWAQTGCAQQKLPEPSYASRDRRETAKLKVKNLVDPNMSPPKLLKNMTPEELSVAAEEAVPLQDESQAHLWHPLFGSNQIKPQQYNSPWRWTTVTVNGE